MIILKDRWAFQRRSEVNGGKKQDSFRLLKTANLVISRKKKVELSFKISKQKKKKFEDQKSFFFLLSKSK